MLDDYDSEKHKQFVFRPNCLLDQTGSEWKAPAALRLATFWNPGSTLHW